MPEETPKWGRLWPLGLIHTIRLLQSEPTWKAAWKDRLKKDGLMSAFTEWISCAGWTWFVTQTFRKDYSLAAVSRLFYRYLVALPSGAAPTVVLWAAELGKAGKRAHLHMLWKWSPSNLRLFEQTSSTSRPAWRIWKEQLWAQWGMARLFPFDKDQGAIPYLSKYILKEDKLTGKDLADWGIWEF